MKHNPCHTCSAQLELSPKAKRAFAMFVGLSSKPGIGPLCDSTNSGKLVTSIEQVVADTISIHRTNLVKCAPLDSGGRLRYPSQREMAACLPKLLAEIEHFRPRVIVPLGGQVSRFLIEQLASAGRFDGFAEDFEYQSFAYGRGVMLPIHHPSYIWIYRRKRLQEYVEAVGNRVLSIAR